MTLQELLNSEMDMASLAALARQGLGWWVDELSAMLPAGWRARLSSRPRTWIEPRPAGGWRVWKDGVPLEGAPTPRDPGVRVGLMLPPDLVLVREIRVPPMPAADVRRMLSLDIDRLSPLAPELIHFDLQVIDRDGGDGRQGVMLGILPRADAALVLTQARADGVAPSAMSLRPDSGGAPCFDFLPQALAASGAVAGSRGRLYAWAAAVALILVNLGVLVGRDMLDVSRLQASVDAQQPAVEAVRRLRRRVEGEDALRRDLIARGVRGDPLRLLNTLTQATPPGAWVQHMEWNGQTLRLVGFRRQDIDMAAAVRGSGSFTNARLLAAETGSATAAIRPFDLTADARPGQRP